MTVGCVWLAAICREMARSAKQTYKIAQSFERFDDRDATLNLRVEGSIPSWLTIFSSALSDGAK